MNLLKLEVYPVLNDPKSQPAYINADAITSFRRVSDYPLTRITLGADHVFVAEDLEQLINMLRRK